MARPVRPSRRSPRRLELDLSTVEPSLAGPKRPQDRVPLKSAKPMFREALGAYVDGDSVQDGVDEADDESFPASDPAAPSAERRARRRRRCGARRRPAARRNPVAGHASPTARECVLDHGAVVDRGDHLVHQHLQPVGDDRRGAAGQEGGREGPDPQAVGQDLARARLEGRHRLLRPGRPDALPRQARLQPRRLRLHDLHRQLRPAHRRGVGRGQRRRPRRHRGAVGQPQLRGPDQPRREDELPRVAAAGRRLRARRLDGRRPAQRPARRPTPTATPVYLRDIWPTPQEIEEVIDQAIASEMFTKDYADVFAGDERWQGLPTPEGDTFEWDAESTYVRKPPYFDGMHARAVAGHRHRRRAGAGQARRLGDDRPHQPGRLDQGRLPRRHVPRRARRRPRATSTPTARGAATTR